MSLPLMYKKVETKKNLLLLPETVRVTVSFVEEEGEVTEVTEADIKSH